MQDEEAKHIGFIPVNLDGSKFVSDSGESMKNRRANADRRADVKDPAHFAARQEPYEGGVAGKLGDCIYWGFA